MVPLTKKPISVRQMLWEAMPHTLWGVGVNFDPQGSMFYGGPRGERGGGVLILKTTLVWLIDIWNRTVRSLLWVEIIHFLPPYPPPVDFTIQPPVSRRRSPSVSTHGWSDNFTQLPDMYSPNYSYCHLTLIKSIYVVVLGVGQVS